MLAGHLDSALQLGQRTDRHLAPGRDQLRGRRPVQLLLALVGDRALERAVAVGHRLPRLVVEHVLPAHRAHDVGALAVALVPARLAAADRHAHAEAHARALTRRLEDLRERRRLAERHRVERSLRGLFARLTEGVDHRGRDRLAARRQVVQVPRRLDRTVRRGVLQALDPDGAPRQHARRQTRRSLGRDQRGEAETGRRAGAVVEGGDHEAADRFLRRGLPGDGASSDPTHQAGSSRLHRVDARARGPQRHAACPDVLVAPRVRVERDVPLGHAGRHRPDRTSRRDAHRSGERLARDGRAERADAVDQERRRVERSHPEPVLGVAVAGDRIARVALDLVVHAVQDVPGRVQRVERVPGVAGQRVEATDRGVAVRLRELVLLLGGGERLHALVTVEPAADETGARADEATDDRADTRDDRRQSGTCGRTARCARQQVAGLGARRVLELAGALRDTLLERFGRQTLGVALGVRALDLVELLAQRACHRRGLARHRLVRLGDDLARQRGSRQDLVRLRLGQTAVPFADVADVLAGDEHVAEAQALGLVVVGHEARSVGTVPATAQSATLALLVVLLRRGVPERRVEGVVRALHVLTRQRRPAHLVGAARSHVLNKRSTPAVVAGSLAVRRLRRLVRTERRRCSDLLRPPRVNHARSQVSALHRRSRRCRRTVLPVASSVKGLTRGNSTCPGRSRHLLRPLQTRRSLQTYRSPGTPHLERSMRCAPSVPTVGSGSARELPRIVPQGGAGQMLRLNQDFRETFCALGKIVM